MCQLWLGTVEELCYTITVTSKLSVLQLKINSQNFMRGTLLL